MNAFDLATIREQVALRQWIHRYRRGQVEGSMWPRMLVTRREGGVPAQAGFFFNTERDIPRLKEWMPEPERWMLECVRRELRA